MGLDIKIPIGLLFTILGLLLTIHGILTFSNTTIYTKSLGINVNLWTGLVMIVFGILMLIFSKWKRDSEA
jgi:uncharacterized membrane protein HdeD (DUF308 family)